MSDYLGPLDVINPVRIIMHIWQDTRLSQADRLERIKRILASTRRSLARVMHPDTGDVHEEWLIQQVNGAYAELEDDSVLPVILDRAIDPADIRRQQSLRDIQHALDIANQRATTLLPFLMAVDWRLLLESSVASELVFGLADEVNCYDHTFTVQCHSDAASQLTELVHPCVGDSLMSLPKAFVEVPRWQRGQWVVRQHTFAVVGGVENVPIERTPMPDAKLETYRYAAQKDYGPVRLVGGITPSDYRQASAALVRPMFKAGAASVVSSRTSRQTGLEWLTPSDCWWLSAIRPVLRPGDYGVIATVNSDNLHLASPGVFLTSRPLG